MISVRIETDTIDTHPTHRPNQPSPQFYRIQFERISTKYGNQVFHYYKSKRIVFLVLSFSACEMSDM